MLIEYQGKRPKLGRNVFIAATATIIGDVEIKDGASIWYGTVLRGDNDRIVVGCDTNIQDNCTVHTDAGFPALIGDRVTVGHNAVIHGCTLDDECLIAINAVVLNGAHIRQGSVVAAGAVVREGHAVGPNQLVAGTPAAPKKTLPSESRQMILQPIEDYRQLSALHRRLAVNAMDKDERPGSSLTIPNANGNQRI
jgi:carbonic anhydrase/acetyltransferase-like protein (isoleucine patch superfamily)